MSAVARTTTSSAATTIVATGPLLTMKPAAPLQCGEGVLPRSSFQLQVPSLFAQWHGARFQAAAQQAATAVQKLEEGSLRSLEAELEREQIRQKEFQAEVDSLRAKAEAQAEEAKRQIEETAEQAKKASLQALENVEDIDLAAFPQRIAEARLYHVDAEKVAELERVYMDKALRAFQAQRVEERLKQAVVQGQADCGRPSSTTQFVTRAVPVPLPSVITTRILTLRKEEVGEDMIHSKKKEDSFEDSNPEEEEEDKSTAASEEAASALPAPSVVASEEEEEEEEKDSSAAAPEEERSSL